MKPLLLYLFVFLCFTARAQTECTYYQKYINRGNEHLANEQFREAINAYSIALVHCPPKTNETWALIMIAFQKIEDLKNKAKDNERKAKENEEKALQAKLLSDAYKFIFFAQEAVKTDPMLGLQLATLSLNILDSVKKSGDYDSLIYEKALRIYYENNFGETIIGAIKPGDRVGNYRKAIYAPDGKSIWTITDSAFAIQWNLNGQRLKTIPLDPSKQFYNFIQADKGRIFIHGYTWYDTKARGKLWNISQNINPIEIPEFPQVDTVTFIAGRDSSEGWAQRLIVLGNKAFSLDDKGNLLPSVNGNSGKTTNIAISPDGKSIALSDATQVVSIFHSGGKKFTINTGIKQPDIEFSPDSKFLVINSSGTLRIYENSSTSSPKEVDYLNLPGYSLQSIDFSKDGNMLLLSFSNPSFQVTQLFKKNPRTLNTEPNPAFNWKSVFYAEFKCPGAFSTSSHFTNDETGFISSSDKIRSWKIPAEKSIPAPQVNSFLNNKIQIISVAYDPQQQVINAFSTNGQKLKFTQAGEKVKEFSDSVYLSDSVSSSIFLLLPKNIKKAVVVSENGDLNMFHEKHPLEAFLKTFRFEPFTEAQKRKYGIK